MLSSKTQSIKNNVVACDARANEVIVHWFADGVWQTRRHEGRAQNVLDFLTNDAIGYGTSLESIEEIGVVMEGPSFTATRVMTVIANTFAFIRHKKAHRLPADFSDRTDQGKSDAWAASAAEDFVIPIYNEPPRITLKT